ncbi:1089_t:CDS:2, partial [Acaulospora colombiana]
MSSPKHSKRLSLPVMPSGALRLKTTSIPPKTPLEALQGQDPSKPTTIKELESKASRDSRRFEWDLLIVGTALKLLLFPAYRSTDFEVHRNWMAITHSLPVSKWYFEYLLSIPASFIDSKMVELDNLNYDSWSVIVYQRSTVIVSELVMALALRA